MVLVAATPDVNAVTTQLPGGGYAIAWTKQNASNHWETHSQLFSATGQKIGAEYVSPLVDIECRTAQSIIALADGGYAMASSRSTLSGDYNQDVVLQRFSANGSPVGSPMTINSTTVGNQSTPSIACLTNGDLAVTWQSLSETDAFGRHPIMMQKFSASGAKIGSETKVGVMARDGEAPVVVATPDGGSLVTWVERTVNGDASTKYSILAQRYSASGEKVGQQVAVETTSSVTRNLDVAALDNGNVAMTWSVYTPEGTRYKSAVMNPAYVATGSGDGTGGTRTVVDYGLNAGNFQGLAVEKAMNGGYIVTHYENQNLVCTRYNADGTVLGKVIVPGTRGLSNEAMNHKVTELMDGSFAVTYSDRAGLQSFRMDLAGRKMAAYSLTDAADTQTAALSNTSFTLFAGAGNDTVLGGAGHDVIDGGKGADKMSGGAGNDTYFVDSSGDQVVEAASAGVDTVFSTVNYSLESVYVENLVLAGAATNGTGNQVSNKITGNSLNNYINGGASADVMIGGTGNDTYVVDNVGDKVIERSTASTEFDTVQSSISYTLTQNVERLILTGSANINATGNAGNNILVGNAGSNILNGGAGLDTASFAAAGNGVSAWLADGSTSGAGGDKLISIEHLIGSQFNDSLYGDANANRLNGGLGADLLNGGLGNDTYVVDNTGDRVSEESSTGGIDAVLSSISFTLGNNLENLSLTGTLNINGTGNALNNSLIGNAGNNTLKGGAGNDVLTGGLGADTLYGGLGADRFDFNSIDEAKLGEIREVIADFNASQGDKIDLSSIDAIAEKTGTNDAFTFIGGAQFNASNASGQLRFENGMLYGSTDADVQAEFQITLLGITQPLTNTDFIA